MTEIITPDWSNKTILIVEDVLNNFIFLRERFSKTNAKLFHAQDGVEAINFCNNTKNVDLILMDIKLPKVNGYEATRSIKASHPQIPIIAQTAYTMSNEQVLIFEAGCDDYISKPINWQLMISKILKVFDS